VTSDCLNSSTNNLSPECTTTSGRRPPSSGNSYSRAIPQPTTSGRAIARPRSDSRTRASSSTQAALCDPDAGYPSSPSKCCSRLERTPSEGALRNPPMVPPQPYALRGTKTPQDGGVTSRARISTSLLAPPVRASSAGRGNGELRRSLHSPRKNRGHGSASRVARGRAASLIRSGHLRI
jgi:hypothetical protein